MKKDFNWVNEGGEPQDNEEDGSVTTNEDYRWRWLSTLWAIIFGFGFALWVFASSVFGFEYPPGTLMGVLTMAWGATVVYVIGPETVEQWKNLRGGK